MWLKKNKDTGRSVKQEQKNVDTTARVRAVLAQLSKADYVVLARYKASKGPDHEIRLGKNNAVFCTGKCWQYSKSGTCKHIEHYRANVAPLKFGRIEKV